MEEIGSEREELNNADERGGEDVVRLGRDLSGYRRRAVNVGDLEGGSRRLGREIPLRHAETKSLQAAQVGQGGVVAEDAGDDLVDELRARRASGRWGERRRRRRAHDVDKDVEAESPSSSLPAFQVLVLEDVVERLEVVRSRHNALDGDAQRRSGGSAAGVGPVVEEVGGEPVFAEVVEVAARSGAC